MGLQSNLSRIFWCKRIKTWNSVNVVQYYHCEREFDIHWIFNEICQDILDRF